MANLKNTEINDNGFFKIPIGTNSQRPGNSETGMIRYNSDEDALEYYDGGFWLRLTGPTGFGGEKTLTDDGTTAFATHSFTSTGSDTFAIG